MSGSEPPSRIPPRGNMPDTKSARDELSSKGKVEKVREVDADETRKRKFLKYYKDEPSTESEEDARLTPFDLISGRKPHAESEDVIGGNFSDTSDTEDAIVPSPPNLTPPVEASGDPSEEATTAALPQSDDFWEDVDFPPDQPKPAQSFQEVSESRKGTQESSPKKRAAEPPKKGESTPPKANAQKKEPLSGPATEKLAAAKDRKPEPSPFGPPGKGEPEKLVVKPDKKGTPPKKEVPNTPFESVARQPKEPEKKPSLFEQIATPSKSVKPPEKKKEPNPSMAPWQEEQAPRRPITRPLEKEEERYLGSTDIRGKQPQKQSKGEEENPLYAEPGVVPFHAEKQDSGGGGGGKKKHDQQPMEIESPSLSHLPSSVQPMAATATAQATPYIQPSTVNLFYQMVGTMYVMSGQQGIQRTEIVLNNPSYADSKFFGSTIRIEKYATAPDSFNITLSGSQAAVQSFKENIPNLMTAFQNGNFTFRVNRLDVEYTVERPVYRRKEKGEERGDTDSGDFSERRK